MRMTEDAATLKPMLDKDGSILLCDMFINGEWIGSRRTVQQCNDQLKSLGAKRPED